MATRKKYKIVLSEKYVRKSENGKEWFQFPVNISGQLVAIQTIIPLDPYTEPDMEQVRKEAYDEGYENGFVAGHLKAEKSGQSFYEDGHQRGLSDAWEAARRIGSNSMCSLKEMGFDFSQCAVPDYNPSWFVVKNYSASEAIEKIRQYEQEKEEQIQVGDEVDWMGDKYVVTYVRCEAKKADLISCKFGSACENVAFSALVKTGRHFTEIAEVLAKMKESDNG